MKIETIFRIGEVVNFRGRVYKIEAAIITENGISYNISNKEVFIMYVSEKDLIESMYEE